MNLDPQTVIANMGGLARQLAHSFLNAAVWRVAWSLPLKTVLLIGVILFIILSL